MSVTPISVPPGSLLAEFGAPDAYRDCFAREVAEVVKLPQLIERFYCSAAFRPERVLLGLIKRGASSEDARRLARGEIDEFAAWKVVSRKDANNGLVAEHGEPEYSLSERARTPALEAKIYNHAQILLRDFRGATASWLAVEPLPGDGTRLLFGSWVGQPDRGLVKALMPFHRLYSKVLLGGV